MGARRTFNPGGRQRQPEIQLLTKTGMALGILPDNAYEQQTVQLKHGDCLFLYTDGVTDAQNPHGEHFGLERLKTLVHDSCGEPVGKIMQRLEQELSDFTGGQEPVDDITMLAIRRV